MRQDYLSMRYLDQFTSPSFRNIKVLTVDQDDPLLEYASYVLIAMGAVVFIVGFLGCCRAIKENKCMLGLYIFFLLLIMAGELAAGILALLYKDEVLNTATEVLVTELKNDTIYTLDKEGKATFTAFGLAMSASQIELKCCGIQNFTDYKGGAFDMEYGQDFPLTCCVMKEGTEIIDGINLEDSVLDVTKCQAKDDEYLNK